MANEPAYVILKVSTSPRNDHEVILKNADGTTFKDKFGECHDSYEWNHLAMAKRSAKVYAKEYGIEIRVSSK